MSDQSMYLLLTIVSVLALWAFLTVLVVGLLLILKPLEAVRGHLQRIGMGVRAIEQQTSPLADLIGRFPAATTALHGGFDSLARTIGGLDRTVDVHHRQLRRARRH